MGKIRLFYIATSLGENQTYLGGSVVQGNVIIELTKPKVISLVPRPLFPFLFVVVEKRVWWISIGTFVLLDLQILGVVNKC